MAWISTVEEMINWVKIDVGAPAVCLELPVTTMEQLILDDIDYFQKHAGTGSYESFVPIQVSAGVSEYDVSYLDASAIVDIRNSQSGSASGSTSLFSNYSELMSNPATSGWISSMGGTTGLEISNFEMSLQSLDLHRMYFEKSYRTVYRAEAKMLKIIPTPTEDGILLSHIFKNEIQENIFNNELFKQYVRATVLIRWGFVLNKRTITIDGNPINGEWIYSEGKEALEIVKQQIIDEQPPVAPIMG